MSRIAQAINEISNAIQNIPNDSLLFMGTLLGALLGFIGSFAAVVFSLLTLWLQFGHNRREAKRGRDFDIKREILLNACEAITNANELLSTLPSTPINDATSKFSDIQLSAHVTKLNLVSSLETIKPINEYMKSFLTSYLDLIIRRGKIDRIEFDIKMTSEEIDNLNKHRESLNAQLHALSINDEQNIFDYIRDRQSKFTARIDHLYNQNSKRYSLISEMRLKCTEIAFRAVMNAGVHSQAALISARNELGLQLNEKDFKKIMKEASEFTEKTITEFMIKAKSSWDDAYEGSNIPELLPENYKEE